jgi:uncharacterized lipoprotein YehR (DUF1307 family)
MKKLLVLVLVFVSFFILTACGTDEIPSDASVAVCDTFKYVFKGDVVYEFYSNDALQSKDMLNIVQNAVDTAGDVQAYLDSTFQEGICVLSSYTSDKE